MTEVQPTPRPRNPEQTRETILGVATSLFATQGYEGTSMQQVAEAAGVAKATPSYFFGSKEGLWRAVLEAQNGAARQVLPRALARLSETSTLEARVHALVDAYLEFLTQHPEFFRLIQWSELQHNPAMRELPSHAEVLTGAVAVVSEVLAQGGRATEDAKQMVMSIIGLCNAHLIYGNTLGRPLGLDVADEAFLDARKAHLKRLLVSTLC